MENDQRTVDATAVTLAVFGMFELRGDEALFDFDSAMAIIQAYGDRRAREAMRWQPGERKVVPLRLVKGH